MPEDTKSIPPVKSISQDRTLLGVLLAVVAVFGTLTAYFISILFAALTVGFYSSFQGYNQVQTGEFIENSVVWQFTFVLLFGAYSLTILYGFMKLMRFSWSSIGLSRKPMLKDAGWGVVTFGLYFLILVAVTALVSQLIPSLNLDQEQQIGFDNATGALNLFLVFVSLVILPPIVEEIVVRGFLFSGLRKGMGVITATILASLLFAVAHLQLGSGAPPLWIAAIDTFILSVVLIKLRLRTGALWSGMFVHALKNGLAFTALFVIN